MRQRDRQLFAELLPENRFGLELVSRIEIRKQERDSDGAEALGAGAGSRLAHRRAMELDEFLTRVVQPAGDGNDVRARDERRRLAKVNIVEPRAVATGDV